METLILSHGLVDLHDSSLLQWNARSLIANGQ